MVDPGEKVTSTLRREFAEEALNGLEMAPTEIERIRERLDALFAHGQEVQISTYFILLLMLTFE